MKDNAKNDISQDEVGKSQQNDAQKDVDLTDVPPKVQKSLFEIAKEIEAKERQKDAIKEQQAIAKHEQERENYAKKLQQDKIELIRLKQGVIEESNIIHEVHEEGSVLTFPQKIGNFFYHNIWWLWIIVLLAIVTSYITYSIVTTPKADATVLLFVTDENLYNCKEQMSDYFEQFIDDNTGDGVSTVKIYYIPIATESNDTNYTSYMAKFSGEMQSANSLIVIADDSCEEILKPDEILYDLSKDFSEYENTKDYGYYLSGTKFAEEIGYNGILADDIYIGIRKVQKIYDSSNKMEENFDIAYELVNRLISYEEGGENIG